LVTWHASIVQHPPLGASLHRLERSSGALATQSVARMDEALPWFRSMPADQRSWVMLVAQAGIAAFVEWLRQPERTPEITYEVFGAAPRELARSVTLQRAVALVRVTIEVVESQVKHLAAPGEEAALREAVLRYSREVAFAAAQVYASAAENRGAWDARLQALLVDALLRGDPDDILASRAAALGWADIAPVAVVVGGPPPGDAETVLDAIQLTAKYAGTEVLAGVQGERLVVVLGGVQDALTATGPLLRDFGAGPVVVGTLAGGLATAGGSARAALAGARAVAAWPGAPRPVLASELLPERALAGDDEARRVLSQDVYSTLRQAGPALLDTLTAYLDCGSTLEGTARALFVHPNTVRYRLRRITDVCGLSPLNARDAFALRVALAVGRLDGVGL
jgi:hypothetical protein